MNTLEQYALDALDEQAMLSLLFDLIAIPSLDGSPEELAVQERVAQELRSQYLVAFAPEALDGKPHRLDVRVKRPGVTVRARKSYLAAAEAPTGAR